MQPVSSLAKGFVTFFMLLYLMLLLGIVLTPEWLAVSAVSGLTTGHLLILSIHILPVIAAWFYLGQRTAPLGDPAQANQQDVAQSNKTVSN